MLAGNYKLAVGDWLDVDAGDDRPVTVSATGAASIAYHPPCGGVAWKVEEPLHAGRSLTAVFPVSVANTAVGEAVTVHVGRRRDSRAPPRPRRRS